MLKVENAIATSFEHFDLVVETFDESTGITIDEVIGDVLEPVLQSFDEIIETN